MNRGKLFETPTPIWRSPVVTKSQIAILLARCAASDQRTIGEADVEAWFEASQIQNWSYQLARRIIAEYYASGAGKPRIDEAFISDRMRALRSAAAASFEAPRVPDDISGRDYPVWYRARRDEHVARVLEHWVQTGVEPEIVKFELEAGTGFSIEAAPEHLRAQLKRDWARIGRPASEPEEEAS